MVRNFILLIFFIFFINMQVYALDVVYPKTKDYSTVAISTFFIGNTCKNDKLTINSESVKVWDDGSFVHYVPLFQGDNKFIIKSFCKGKKQTLTYNVKRLNKQTQKTSQPAFIPKRDGAFLYTKTINENSTVREKPSSSSKRVMDLPKGIVLYLAGSQGEYYKIENDAKTQFWIHKSNIEEPVAVTKKMVAKVKDTKYSSDNLYNYVKIPISYPVFYTIVQDEKKLKLTLYGATNIKTATSNCQNQEFIFEDENQVLGYDCYYEEDKFVLRKAKIADNINPNKPLYGVRIFIDAGHGGIEKGSIGPTRVPEKDINLAISKKLIKLLKEEGAIVSYSRIDDRKVSLYDRVKMAKDNNAFISLSIHNNALTDGLNPYVNHGTETHYYNDNAKVLAYIIKNNLVKDLNLKDNGLHKSSFALNRSTNPVSVLVEVAYMINPTEYKLLKSHDFQQKAALSITKSLREFMILLKK